MNEKEGDFFSGAWSQPPSEGDTGSAAAAGWYSVKGDATTERYWDGHAWTQGFRSRPASSGGRILVGVLTIMAFLGGGVMMASVQAASSDSIFEPLINGVGWVSIGAAGATLMALLRP